MNATCPKSFWKKDGKDSKPVQPNSVLVHLVLVSVQVCLNYNIPSVRGNDDFSWFLGSEKHTPNA